YLNLRAEPPLWPVLAGAALFAAAVLAIRRRAARPALLIPLLLLAFGAAGLTAGKLRTELVRAPVMPESQSVGRIDGWVVDVASPGAGGGRLLIAPVRIEGLAPEVTPKRVRVTVGPEALIGPGSAVRMTAMLGPPPPPASPGSYDFARDAWFDGVGGVGFALKAPAIVELSKAPWRLRAEMAVNAMRWSLARRIVSRMGEHSGGLAAAMTTGHEAWISRQQTEDMRASGLAHIISISGLHMAIVGGFAFAAARMVIAGWPWLALRINGKKAAAVFGMGAVVGYLVVSGAPPPAERAAITALVAFAAILADRRAISLHALAVAALIILALHPEAACEPGFQMSFAATTALVALAEAWKRPAREIEAPWWIRFPQNAGLWIAAAIGVSLVAGLATGPFAMQHFNRVASFGLLANLLVAPLSSFVIMPALALGATLEPFGLGGPFLTLAGWGIDGMTTVAARVSALPGSQMLVASAPPAALPISFFGILVMCLWRGHLRWLGLPLSLAVLLWPRPPAPDLWIASDGATAAMREGDAAILLRPESRRFAADLWARRRGLAIPEEERFTCDRRSCVLPEAGPIALWSAKKPPTAEQLASLCERGEVVVVRSAAPGACQGRLVLDKSDFERGGSAELYRAGSGWRIVWAQTLRGERPWSETPLPEGEGGARAKRSGRVRVYALAG
ncbi:MAG TPA: ComEC/Rec2 family competence protein, partial [Caulobacteraceae bacterium]|nr:ComEC/Rec2 family competence protein [Caulobacteraceae bacterium]